MLEIAIPGAQPLCLDHLVLDYNGTLAVDGRLLSGVADLLRRLAAEMTVHVVTADTFGLAPDALSGLPCRLTVLPPQDQDAAKLRYVETLGAARCAAVGNGRNDRSMLAAAALGICVVQGEGASVATLLAADVAAPDILAALGLLLEPRRLVATLRQ